MSPVITRAARPRCHLDVNKRNRTLVEGQDLVAADLEAFPAVARVRDEAPHAVMSLPRRGRRHADHERRDFDFRVGQLEQPLDVVAVPGLVGRLDGRDVHLANQARAHVDGVKRM